MSKAHRKSLYSQTKGSDLVISYTLINLEWTQTACQYCRRAQCPNSTAARGCWWNNIRLVQILTLFTRWLFFIVKANSRTLFPALIPLGWYECEECCVLCCSSGVELLWSTQQPWLWRHYSPSRAARCPDNLVCSYAEGLQIAGVHTLSIGFWVAPREMRRIAGKHIVLQ